MEGAARIGMLMGSCVNGIGGGICRIGRVCGMPGVRYDVAGGEEGMRQIGKGRY